MTDLEALAREALDTGDWLGAGRQIARANQPPKMTRPEVHAIVDDINRVLRRLPDVPDGPNGSTVWRIRRLRRNLESARHEAENILWGTTG